MEELKAAYEETSGERISYNEILEVLEGKRILVPITERIVRLLEELGHIYYIASGRPRGGSIVPQNTIKGKTRV